MNHIEDNTATIIDDVNLIDLLTSNDYICDDPRTSPLKKSRFYLRSELINWMVTHFNDGRNSILSNPSSVHVFNKITGDITAYVLVINDPCHPKIFYNMGCDEKDSCFSQYITLLKLSS